MMIDAGKPLNPMCGHQWTRHFLWPIAHQCAEAKAHLGSDVCACGAERKR